MTENKPFHIYRSSAGSGKTRTLAREYIMLALRHPEYFKYTLAVTFANKSAQEMKDRIIRYLNEFANPEKATSSSALAIEIQTALGLDETDLRLRSADVLSRILHQYSQFSISTIDAFFQRVIRAFTRESGLLGNFRLESENELVLDDVIAMLMDELGPDQPDLTKWVIQFSKEKLESGAQWNISYLLKRFAEEIFKENYKMIAEDIREVGKRLDFRQFLGMLRAEKQKYLGELRIMAAEAMNILEANGITSNDFNYGDSGTAWKFFNEFANERRPNIGTRITSSATDSGDWPSKKSAKRDLLKKLAESSLMGILNRMLDYDKNNIIRFKSAEVVEQNFYQYGLLTDITRKLTEYKAENNIMLLSDASHFLNGIINDSDTPFIYEKVGSFYRHYLIDEFQDTSGMQWSNFKPLIMESLDQGNMSLVVGDVKQSVYRWRGGDLSLLQETIEKQVGDDNTTRFSLLENWRSAENLVNFNNVLFESGAQQVGKATGHSLPEQAFEDLVQKPVNFPGRGYVRVEFIDKWKSEADDSGQAEAMRRIPRILEELQGKGVPAGDITILVRKNREGQEIADFLMQYRTSDKIVPGVKYDVISSESLRLDSATSVLLLLSALRYLSNPDDAVARGELVFEFNDIHKKNSAEENEHHFSQAGRKRLAGLVPEEFIKNAPWLLKLSLFELTETLIRMFGLGENNPELVYLQSFQDIILDFGSKDKNDIASFLEWWEEIKDKQSIKVAAKTDAVSIFTIHKAKGLQFKYVIIPFCSWAMNHERSPLLWAKSDIKPFDELGYVVVEYASSLKETFFAADYENEFTRTYLENLNLLYVGLTRAEEGMILMAPAPSGRPDDGKISNVGQIMYKAITSIAGLTQYYDGATATLTIGKIERLAEPRDADGYTPETLTHYPASDWRSRLVIRREGREFFHDQATYQRQRINFGILSHTILARITHRDDVDEVLRGANFEGIITKEEHEPLAARIAEMMRHPVIAVWFDKEWNVRTETPVILPAGALARIDRVISKEITVKGQVKRKAVIIDYKTGAKKTADRQQVEEYTSILSSMGYVDVEGYLLYLDELEVVRVVSKLNLELF